MAASIPTSPPEQQTHVPEQGRASGQERQIYGTFESAHRGVRHSPGTARRDVC